MIVEILQSNIIISNPLSKCTSNDLAMSQINLNSGQFSSFTFAQQQKFDFFLDSPSFNSNNFLLQKKISIEDDSLFEPFVLSIDDTIQDEKIEISLENQQNRFVHKNKKTKRQKLAPSQKSKNICFNIIQKSIKVLKDDTYEDKIEQFTKQQNLSIDEFIAKMLSIRKQFTGPKALIAFLDQNSKYSRIFSKFLRWFLSNKYLRFALNHGEMKDVGEYIDFKNKVMLPMLQ